MTLTRVNSNGITDGTIADADVSASAAINKTKISGTAITAADTGTVTSALIADASVTDAKVANSAITTAKIADANVTSGKLASGAAVANIGYTPVNKAGDTVTGTLNFSGGGGTAAMPVRQTRFGYSSTYSVLQLGSPSSGQTISLYVDPASNNSGNFDGNGSELLVPQNFKFCSPTASNTTFLNPMRFEDGRVLTPNVPCFAARGLSNTSVNSHVSTTPSTLLFSNVYTNNGNHYNSATGRFTAPVAGHYYIAWNILVDNNALAGSISAVMLSKNGSGTGFVCYDENPGSRYQMMSQSMVIYLAANEYVEAVANSGYIHTGSETSWTGFLIG